MPFQHNLSCPHAGQWQALFSEKSTQKLSTTPFAKKEVLLLSSSLPQSSDVENRVNFGLCLGWTEWETTVICIILP